MARIRTIKPEFWTDEKLSRLDLGTRLVFLGLISMADDAGRLIDNVKLLDGQLFPNTDDSCFDSLNTLAELGRIVRYRTPSGQGIIEIVSWKRHQRIDRPGRHVLPARDVASIEEVNAGVGDVTAVADVASETRETLASVARESRDPILDLGSGTMDRGSRTGGVDRSVDQSVGDGVSAFVGEFAFGAFAGAVAALCRSAARPDAVVGVLRMHVRGADGYEPGTALQVGNACQQYAANGAVFNSALFAGFLRRAKKGAQRVASRARDRSEATAIAVETRQRKQADREEKDARRTLDLFKKAHPAQYELFHERAEAEVPATITMGREYIVHARVLQMIRREAA